MRFNFSHHPWMSSLASFIEGEFNKKWRGSGYSEFRPMHLFGETYLLFVRKGDSYYKTKFQADITNPVEGILHTPIKTIIKTLEYHREYVDINSQEYLKQF